MLVQGAAFDNWGIGTLVNYPPGWFLYFFRCFTVALLVWQPVPQPCTCGSLGNDHPLPLSFVGTGRREVDNGGNTGPYPVELPCQCSDAAPRNPDTQTVTSSCFFQRAFNNCQLEYMFDADAELAAEGFCQMSCDRCNCCSPPSEVLRTLGANTFSQVIETAGFKDLFDHTGLTATIFVPTDEAMQAAVSALGPLAQNKDILAQIVKFHIVPPEPRTKALWTTPFFSLGPTLFTLYDGPETLSTSKFELPSGTTWRGGLTGFNVSGPVNSARVTQGDVMACKSYFNVIDTVLLPFDPETLPTDNPVGAALEASTCNIQNNAVASGTVVKSGDSNVQETIGDCCESCSTTSGCNAFVYCSLKGGCELPESQSIQFGSCTLLNNEGVAKGGSPFYSQNSVLLAPQTSGWIPATVQSTEGSG